MRRRLLVAAATLVVPGSWLAAQTSANDFILGQIVSIDAEASKVTLRHEPIAHLYLPAGTTTFRYVESRLLIGRKAGDRVRFRADRIDLALRITALLFIRVSGISCGIGSKPPLWITG